MKCDYLIEKIKESRRFNRKNFDSQSHWVYILIEKLERDTLIAGRNNDWKSTFLLK